MGVEFDQRKRAWTLKHRRLDMAKAAEIFRGFTIDREDDRDHGEIRVITVGRLGRKIVVCVWTERARRRRIISLREAEKDERERYLFRAP